MEVIATILMDSKRNKTGYRLVFSWGNLERENGSNSNDFSGFVEK